MSASPPENITATAAWKTLSALHEDASRTCLWQRFCDDPQRAATFSLNAGPLFVDFSKHHLDSDILDALLALAETAGLPARLQQLMSGAEVNITEHRSAAHNVLRQYTAAADPAVRSMFESMTALVERVHRGELRSASGESFTDVVNIGIGGSDFGPRLVCDALAGIAAPRLGLHFLSNIDPASFHRLSRRLDPHRTLFLVSSKSFSTEETLANHSAARNWLQQVLGSSNIDSHFVAVTANAERARARGMEEIIAFPEWVGGRFSVWSAIGLPIALGYGMDNFRALLRGGAVVDAHVQSSPLRHNAPVILGLLDVWYRNFWQLGSLAVLPYADALKLLPDYLQQLFMESNGKSTALDGTAMTVATCPVLWGSAGTNGQHSFHQMLHQGSTVVPCDFVLPLSSHTPIADQQQRLVANCLSQSLVLMKGRSAAEIAEELVREGMPVAEAAMLARHKAMPGNRPSTTITCDRVNAETLGALIALYEHRMFTASAIWNINAFDQWGVELGKKTSQQLLPALAGQGTGDVDSSTRQLIEHFRAANSR